MYIHEFRYPCNSNLTVSNVRLSVIITSVVDFTLHDKYFSNAFHYVIVGSSTDNSILGMYREMYLLCIERIVYIVCYMIEYEEYIAHRCIAKIINENFDRMYQYAVYYHKWKITYFFL